MEYKQTDDEERGSGGRKRVLRKERGRLLHRAWPLGRIQEPESPLRSSLQTPSSFWCGPCIWFSPETNALVWSPVWGHSPDNLSSPCYNVLLSGARAGPWDPTWVWLGSNYNWSRTPRKEETLPHTWQEEYHPTRINPGCWGQSPESFGHQSALTIVIGTSVSFPEALTLGFLPSSSQPAPSSQDTFSPAWKS